MQIPLVIYKKGKAQKIGMVSLGEDGQILGQIEKDHLPEIRESFYPQASTMSLNPKQDV